MTINVVTSCSLAGWNAYGQRMLHTLHKHWPKEVQLHIVSEHELPVSEAILAERNIVTWDLLKSMPKAEAFYKRHDNVARSNGREFRQARNGYSFRHDAVKFSKKVFAIELVADCMIGGGDMDRLIWVDADTTTYADIPMDLLQQQPPEGYALACLDRGRYHSECGWIGYNLAHPEAYKFIKAFSQLYYSDQVFQLMEWHDSWVFDWLRKRMKISSFHIPHKSVSHPFVHSELGRYMDHLKGARKLTGASPDHPRSRKRKAEISSALKEHERAQGKR